MRTSRRRLDLSVATDGLLRLPEVQVDVYERPPLVLTLCQVKFPAQLRIADEKAVAPFQEALRERYPVLSKQAALEIQLSVAAAGGAAYASGPPAHTWQFGDESDDWKVV